MQLQCENMKLTVLFFVPHASHHLGCLGAPRIITHPALTPASPKEQQQGRSARPTAH